MLSIDYGNNEKSVIFIFIFNNERHFAAFAELWSSGAKIAKIKSVLEIFVLFVNLFLKVKNKKKTAFFRDKFTLHKA